VGNQFRMFLWTSGTAYPLTHHKVESSKQFSYYFLSVVAVTVVLLKFQVFQDVVMCHWVSSSNISMDCSSAFIFRVSKSKVLKTKTLRTSKMSGATYPKTGVTYQKTWMSSSLLLLHTSVSSHTGAGVLLCHHYDQMTSYTSLTSGLWNERLALHSVTLNNTVWSAPISTEMVIEVLLFRVIHVWLYGITRTYAHNTHAQA